MAINKLFGDHMKWSTWENIYIYIYVERERERDWERSDVLHKKHRLSVFDWEEAYRQMRINVINPTNQAVYETCRRIQRATYVNLLVS